MLPILITIVSIYCCVRLIEVAMNAGCMWKSTAAVTLQWLLSVVAVLVIGILAVLSTGDQWAEVADELMQQQRSSSRPPLPGDLRDPEYPRWDQGAAASPDSLDALESSVDKLRRAADQAGRELMADPAVR